MTVLEREHADGVTTLRLNRPEALNAISSELARALLEALGDLAADPETRAVVVTGNGRGFCAGADLGDIGGELFAGADGEAGKPSPQDVLAAAATDSIPLAEALFGFPKPLIAAVNGPCAGAGLALAFSADIVVASDTASFSVLFVHRGLVPDFGVTHFLPRLVGLRKARELCLLGDRLSAAVADELGLLTAVAPADRLMDEAMGYARRLAQGPPVAQRLTKELLADSFTLGPAEAVEREFSAQALCFGTADALEGVAAFLEKRAPKFSGR